MFRPYRILAAVLVLTGLSACEPTQGGAGAAPASASQQSYDSQAAARRSARSAYYRGPRGGHSGR
jgi:hypothetical protein